MTGIDPVLLTEYSVIFSVVALPLTYLPILLVANDKAYMGRLHERPPRQRLRADLPRRSSWSSSLTAIPLMILTNGGTG